MASTTTATATLVAPRYLHRGISMTPIPLQSSDTGPTSILSKFETLPVEIVDQILSYLIHPRCRLPGLTKAQSDHSIPEKLKRSIKDQEDLDQSPDGDRWAADI